MAKTQWNSGHSECQSLRLVHRMQSLHSASTYKPLYNSAGYNMILDITLYTDGPQRCIDYIEK